MKMVKDFSELKCVVDRLGSEHEYLSFLCLCGLQKVYVQKDNKDPKLSEFYELRATPKVRSWPATRFKRLLCGDILTKLENTPKWWGYEELMVVYCKTLLCTKFKNIGLNECLIDAEQRSIVPTTRNRAPSWCPRYDVEGVVLRECKRTKLLERLAFVRREFISIFARSESLKDLWKKRLKSITQARQ